MDYDKIPVGQLRKICRSRNIARCTGPEYIKKAELVKLLKGLSHTINRYDSMNVPELRKLAVAKGLIRGSKYIPKKDLVEMLTQNTSTLVRKNPCFDGW